MGKLNKKIYTQKTMDFKTGILALTIVIAIVGMMASSVSAYTYVVSHTENWWSSCTTTVYSPNNHYISATCDSGFVGRGYAIAISGNGSWKFALNRGKYCMPPKHFKAKSRAGGMTYKYAWVGCSR